MEPHIDIKNVICGGIVLVSYGQYSLGWRLGMEYFRDEVERGSFGIILNTTVPVRKLIDRARSAGFDIMKAGNEGNLAVVNIFEEESDLDFVYRLGTTDRTLLMPRVESVMREIASRYGLRERRVVGMIATVDGLYELFGGEFLKKLLRTYLVKSEELVGMGYDHRSILIVNRDTVPTELHSWIVSISDYVILTEGLIDRSSLIENTVLLKSLDQGFSRRMFQERIDAKEVKGSEVKG